MTGSDLLMQILALFWVLLSVALHGLNDLTSAVGVYDYYDRIEVEPQFAARIGSADVPGFRLVFRESWLDGASSNLSWSADSKRFARLGVNSHHVYDITGKTLYERRGNLSYYFGGILHPNGKWIVWRSSGMHWSVQDISTGEILHKSQKPFYGLKNMLFSPAGDRLIVATSYYIVVYDTADWSIVWEYEHEIGVSDIAISPDNRTLAYEVRFPTSGAVILDYRHFKKVARLNAGQQTVTPLAYTRDGRTLVTGGWGLGDQPKVMDQTEQQERRWLDFWHVLPGPDFGTKVGSAVNDPQPDAGIRILDVAPDDLVVAASSHDYGTVELFHMPTKQRYAVLPTQEWGVRDVVFSPDGQYLAAMGLSAVYLWQREVTH